MDQHCQSINRGECFWSHSSFEDGNPGVSCFRPFLLSCLLLPNFSEKFLPIFCLGGIIMTVSILGLWWEITLETQNPGGKLPGEPNKKETRFYNREQWKRTTLSRKVMEDLPEQVTLELNSEK